MSRDHLREQRLLWRVLNRPDSDAVYPTRTEPIPLPFRFSQRSITQITSPCRAQIHHFLLLCLAGRKWPGHSRLTVSDWSEDDVSAWLQEEGLESLVDTFKANNIDGTELLSLSKESLSSDLHIGNANTHTHTPYNHRHTHFSVYRI